MRIQDEHMTSTTITSPPPQEVQGEGGVPPHAREMSSTIPTKPSHGRQILCFLWHFGEMVLAMLLGMAVFGVLNNAILIPMGFAYLSVRVFPQAYILAMAGAMTVPMVAWMRIRKHSWQLSAEMGGDDSSQRLADHRLLERTSSWCPPCSVPCSLAGATLPATHRRTWLPKTAARGRNNRCSRAAVVVVDLCDVPSRY